MSYQVNKKIANPNFENVFDISAQEVLDHASDFTIIDVRQPEEYTGELGHIKNAKLIPLGTIPDQFKTISVDKPVVFICRSGMRSAQASAYAQSQGVTNTFNMNGGMLAWNQLQFPVEKNN